MYTLKQSKTNKNLSKIFLFFPPAIIHPCKYLTFLFSVKKNVNTNVMASLFLSWIKNFTLDCTRYYDKLFTLSDINFFLKQQQTLCNSFSLINKTCHELRYLPGEDKFTRTFLLSVVSGCQHFENSDSCHGRAPTALLQAQLLKAEYQRQLKMLPERTIFTLLNSSYVSPACQWIVLIKLTQRTFSQFTSQRSDRKQLKITVIMKQHRIFCPLSIQTICTSHKWNRTNQRWGLHLQILDSHVG